MSVDKLVDSTQLDSDLTSVANAIRTKGGTSASLAFPAGFVSAIAAIPSGGGGPARMTDHEEFTPTTTLTNSNKLSVNLTSGNNCLVLVMTDVMPTPPASGMTALAWGGLYTTNGNSGSSSSLCSILRANGTIGNDSAMCSYNTSTGVLQIGGSYGYFPAGAKYHIYRFEMGV